MASDSSHLDYHTQYIYIYMYIYIYTEPENLASLHVLLPFYSNQHALLPRSPYNCEFKRLGQPRPCAWTHIVPIAIKSHFALAQALPSPDACRLIQICQTSFYFQDCARIGTWKCNTKCDFLTIGKGLSSCFSWPICL